MKVRITFNDARRRYEVYETEGDGKPMSHHSFHQTHAAAQQAQRAQQKKNRLDAAKAEKNATYNVMRQRIANQ